MSTVMISAADVNKLRLKTGAGMMDCKKALTESNGDFEAAIDYLRKKGAKVSASRSDRETKEGVVIARSSEDGTHGIIIELNCETDFVAKNADFIEFGNTLANLALAKNPSSVQDLLNLTYYAAGSPGDTGIPGKSSTPVSAAINEQTGKIGEKISVSKLEKITASKVVAYIHANYKLGVLVGLSQDVTGASEAGKDVSMQIAAMNPVSIDKNDVDATVIERELEIAREQVKTEGKPDNMIEKIAQGKLNKFYKDSTLLNQEFVKDSSKTIAQMLDAVHKGLTVTAFKRVQLGV